MNVNNLIKKLAKRYNVSEDEAKRQIDELTNELMEDFEISREQAEEIVNKAIMIDYLLN